jgi:hypothetical protein
MQIQDATAQKASHNSSAVVFFAKFVFSCLGLFLLDGLALHGN